MRRLGSWAVGGLAAAGFYWLLIDTTQSPELYAGAGVVVLALVAYVVSRDPALEAQISVRSLFGGTLRSLSRAPLHLLYATGEAFAQLLHPKPSRGRITAIPFPCGNPDAQRPEDLGQRVLAEVLGSLTPNTVVVGIDRERGLLVVHQLHRREITKDLRQ